MDNKGLAIEGKFNHPIIGIVECETGICAERWTQFILIPADTLIEDVAEMEAEQNAQSFGYEDCECEEEDCDSCANGLGSMQDVSGTVYKYWPSKSGDYVNGGDPQHEVIEACLDHDGIRIADNTAFFDLEVLQKLLYMPGDTREDDIQYLMEGIRVYTKSSDIDFIMVYPY